MWGTLEDVRDVEGITLERMKSVSDDVRTSKGNQWKVVGWVEKNQEEKSEYVDINSISVFYEEM